MSAAYERCKLAADYIRERMDTEGAIGIVLGSGLSELGNEIKDPVVIDYKDIPDFPVSTISLHENSMVCGYLEGKKVLCMKGRFHYYEGFDMESVIMPIRVMKLLGVKFVILTNASGGVNESFKEGTLMFVDDFINFMGENPLRGPNADEFGLRFPDMVKAIDPKLNSKAKKIAADLGIETRSGVYMAFRGPSFETPAEIRFARLAGADVVGMSSVPEIIAARHCGLPVICLSCVTNMGAGITGNVLSVEEVTDTIEKIKNEFKTLIKGLIRDL